MFYTRLQLTPIHPVKRIFQQIPIFKESNETVFPQIRQSANYGSEELHGRRCFRNNCSQIKISQNS